MHTTAFFARVLVLSVVLGGALGVADVRSETPVEFHLRKGREYFNQGQFKESVQEMTKVIRLQPRHAVAYNDRGAAYARLGQLDQALADYDKALEINPHMALARYNRGRIWYQKKQYDLALVDLNRVYDLARVDANFYNFRGHIHFLVGKLDLALADFSKAIEMNPREPVFFHNRILTYLKKGQHDKAWEDVQKAQSLGLQVRPELVNEARRGRAPAEKKEVRIPSRSLPPTQDLQQELEKIDKFWLNVGK